jgi:hypothetical protein
VDVVSPLKEVVGLPPIGNIGENDDEKGTEETGDDTETDTQTGTGTQPVHLPKPPIATDTARVTVRRITAAQSDGAQFEGKWPQAMPYCAGQGTNGPLTAGSQPAPDCDKLLRVISISLYGGNPRYTTGAIRNSEAVRDAFPDWKLWVYIPDPSSNPNWEVCTRRLSPLHSTPFPSSPVFFPRF